LELYKNICSKTFGDVFMENNLKIFAFGNVLSSISFLHGIAAEELTEDELDYDDSAFDMLIAVGAEK
jgi:hypothetical protein